MLQLSLHLICFLKKPLQFIKAYKIAELSTYSLLIFFDL